MLKRKRDPTFSNSEKTILIDLVRDKFHIIECKKSDTVTVKKKQEEWVKIADEFNSVSSIYPRDSTVLKNCWENLKKRAKLENTLRNQNYLKTGGGPPKNDKEDPILNSVLELIQTRVSGFVNIYDSDGMSVLATGSLLESQADVGEVEVSVESDVVEPVEQEVKHDESTDRDLDRELALLRQKRELLEGQQNRLHRGGGGRGNRRGGGGGGGGGGGHPISPWDENATIRPLFNNSSDFNPQNSGGSGFNYSNLYEQSPRDQFRAPSRRNDSRKRVDTSWSDRPNNVTVARPPPRKRTRPNPPAEPRFQSAPRAPHNNAGPESNRNSYKERPAYRNNRAPNAPYTPPTKSFRPRTAPNGREQPPATAAEGDVLRANIEPHPKVRGRLEHALGIILQNMKNCFPDKEVLFTDPVASKTMKQIIRDRIKGLLLGKQVGSPSEIVVVYRQSFSHDDDVIKSGDTLISTRATKVASNLDNKVQSKDARPSATPVVAKRSEPVTVAKQRSGPTAEKTSQPQPRPARSTAKRNPEADIILGHFKENMHWAIDSELRLMFDNLKELYKEQDSSDVNIRDSIKKVILLQRAQLEARLNKSLESAETAVDVKVEATQADTSVDENKTPDADKKETNDGEAQKTAEKDDSQAENGEDQAVKGEDQAETGKDQAETGKDQAEKGEVQENGPDQTEKNSEVAPVKGEEATETETELNKTSAEIQKLCNYILGVWLYKHLPVILPKFRETVGKIVRSSLYERVQEETGQKETPIPARAAAVSHNPDGERYYVSVVGRPKLPKRPKLSAFLWRFNPCSVKRHKSLFNLLFVGFSNKEDYDRILQTPQVTFGESGNIQVFIKASRARPTNEENKKLIENAKSNGTDEGVVIVEDCQGTDAMIEDTDNSKTDFTDDVVSVNLADKDKKVTIKTDDDGANKKDGDGSNKNDEKEHFLDNMLDGAIVLDSVGDEDDELMFIDNPAKDSNINVTVDLDETVILGEDDNATQEKALETIDDPQENAVDEKAAVEDTAAVVNDEKKEDVTKQETAEEKAAGVTTRRSTRLNN